MTDLAEAPSDGGRSLTHPLVAFTAGLGGALDRVAGVPAWSMSAAEQQEVLLDLRRQRARLVALELRVLVEADRNDIGAGSGATSTAAWLAEATGSTRASCWRDVSLAHALDEEFPATRDALAAGLVDEERAAVVVTSVRALSEEYEDLPTGACEAAERHLVGLAQRFDVAALRRLGRRVFEVVCPEAADAQEGRSLAQEEERARRLAYLTVRENGDGTAEGRFRLPTLHAQLLSRAVEALTSPRRAAAPVRLPGAAGPQPVEGGAGVRSGSRGSGASRRGQGLMQLLEAHLDLSSMPAQAGSPFTVVVTIGLDALVTGLGVGTADTGCRLSAGAVRRLACRAGIIPMVLDGKSVPLDLGRERRLFSKHQRIALAQMYGGCAAVNCDRPPSWTEAHHLDAWAAGGRTDLRRGLSLCPAHHHMADQPDLWTMGREPDGGVRFSRRRDGPP